VICGRSLFRYGGLVAEGDLLVLAGGLHEGERDLQGGLAPAAVVEERTAVHHGLVQLLDLVLAAGLLRIEYQLASTAIFIDIEPVSSVMARTLFTSPPPISRTMSIWCDAWR
jgi:hypothetical protein